MKTYSRIPTGRVAAGVSGAHDGRAARRWAGSDYSDAIGIFHRPDRGHELPDGTARAGDVCRRRRAHAAWIRRTPTTRSPIFRRRPMCSTRFASGSRPTRPARCAWCEIGDCDLQLTNYVAATNAYAQVFDNTNSPADVSLRSQAQIGFGIALEKMAALASGARTRSRCSSWRWTIISTCLTPGLEINLRAGETADRSGWKRPACRRCR